MEVAIVAVSATMLGLAGVLVWNFIDRRSEALKYREAVRELGDTERQRDSFEASAVKALAEAKDAKASAAALRDALIRANEEIKKYEAQHLHDIPADRFSAELDRVLSGQAPSDPAAGNDRGQPGSTVGVRPGPASSDGTAVDPGSGTTRGPVEPNW